MAQEHERMSRDGKAVEWSGSRVSLTWARVFDSEWFPAAVRYGLTIRTRRHAIQPVLMKQVWPICLSDLQNHQVWCIIDGQAPISWTQFRGVVDVDLLLQDQD